VGFVHFDKAKNLIIVNMAIEGPDGGELRILHAVFDTGSSSTIIPWDVAISLGYDPARVTQRRKIVTGSGVEYAPVITVRKLTAIGESISNINVLCHDLPEDSKVDGLLGLNFLKHFDIDILFSKGTVDIRPNKAAEE
jgi:predicted aspartyl protease